MVIAIDAGNSALKVAPVTDGRVGDICRVPSVPVDAGALQHALDVVAPPGTAIALVSVVPAWTATVRDVATASGRSLMVADAGTIPMPVALERPDQVGADRLLAAWAARETHGAPVVVVDLGTATTIDAVDAEGRFTGGVIAPGPALQIAALASGTAQLPPVPVEAPPSPIGRSTLEAIQAGTVLGHVEAISGLVRRIAGVLGGAPAVVLTGGGSATAWARQIEGVTAVDPDLVLRGLGALAAQPAPMPR
jgi:type III pantothenate kinase